MRTCYWKVTRWWGKYMCEYVSYLPHMTTSGQIGRDRVSPPVQWCHNWNPFSETGIQNSIYVSTILLKHKNESPGWCGSVVECHPVNLKVMGSISGQGTCQVVGLIPGWSADKRQPIHVSLSHQHLSFSLSLPLFPFLFKINKHGLG